VRKDGSRFWANVAIDPVRDESGELVGFVKITRDITERKLAEATLLEQAAQFRTLIETAVDGVIMIDANGTVLTFNPACEKLFGYTAQEVIGQNVKMLMPTPYRDAHDGYLANYLGTGVRKIIGIGREVVGQRKDGSTFPMDLSVGEAERQGRPLFVGIIHDLTSRKRTEEQLVQAQKMETVGQLSGGIAHDFNNLLTVILGNAEALSARLKARQDLRHLADTIVSAADRGAELTRRLLAFSRRQMLQPTAINCNALVENMQVLLRSMLREDIELHLAVTASPVFAMADPAQLESALLNLALNAQDAMPDGGVLTLTTEEMQVDPGALGRGAEIKPGRYVCVCVTDDGVGMDAETLQHVFEPFFTTKEVGKGSGLGLSMVYGFVKQSNGHVTIYSEPGLGTSVRLYLPVADGQEAPETAARENGAGPPPRGSETILVVEDDPFVRSHAIASLESLGYSIVVAADGREALALLTSGVRPNLLFTDIVMPGGITGWELAAQARELAPGMRVLFTSGYPQEALTRRGRIDAQAPMLAKPFRLAELARRVRETLDAT
jgi:PAS domain S-box-containing protein